MRSRRASPLSFLEQEAAPTHTRYHMYTIVQPHGFRPCGLYKCEALKIQGMGQKGASPLAGR